MIIFKHSHFAANEFGHGGEKRTAQINELLINARIEFQESRFDYSFSSSNKAVQLFNGFIYHKNIKAGVKNTYATGRYLKMFENFIKENKPRLFIWESTAGYYLLLAEILYKHHIPCIALPHNIESLVDGSNSSPSNKNVISSLTEELKYLNYCQKIFTISKEEEWLLANSGADVTYLPYYPTRNAEHYLLKIRAQKQQFIKQKADKKDILILGTFYNKPTFDGYVELIQNIKSNNQLNIHIAGFGSELLRDVFTEKNIRVWGSISNTVLEELIIKCDYAIIHHRPSSGSLTRISELLLAGIPIIANIHAAKSQANLKGVTVYNTYTELYDILHSLPPDIPPVLKRPAEEQLFIDYIEAFIAD